MTLPQPLRPSVVAMLDRYARDRLTAAIGHDASRYASRYDFERARTCRRCCIDVADPDDPMGMCGPCAARDARP